ncbi:MAG: hypothetical protein PHO01_06340 [Desulfotomaculaceae bacterium]|nr:hypothetical protein [Desulfotomaculaceae bacterium]
MKDNTKKFARIGMLLLVLCLVSTAMLSGTFAKYTSEYAGADTALIAKWDVTVKEGTNDFEISPAVAELDLFSHAYDTNILGIFEGDPIIAPGVKGDFVLNVENKGDVAAKMNFDFTVSGSAATAPIEYSLDGTNWGNLAALKASLEALDDMESVDETEGTATATVQWRWAFEQDPTDPADGDETDTALGVASTEAAAEGTRTTYILTITATATQISPETTP